MANIPEQERQFLAQLEDRSIEQVKRQLDHGEIPPIFVFAASKWVSDKEREAARKKETWESEAKDLARSANDSALEANSIARDAAASARRSADAANTSNMIATLALIAAAVAIAISIVGLFLKR